MSTNIIVAKSETTSEILSMLIVGIIFTLLLLNFFDWKKRSHTFKIWSYILDVPLLSALMSLIWGFLYPLINLYKIHNTDLCNLATTEVFITIGKYILGFLAFGFFILGMVNLLSPDDKHPKTKHNKELPMRKRVSSHVIIGTICLVLAMAFIFIGNSGDLDMHHVMLTGDAYHYRTSKVYRHYVNSFKAKSYKEKHFKRAVQHFKGNHFKRYI